MRVFATEFVRSSACWRADAPADEAAESIFAAAFSRSELACLALLARFSVDNGLPDSDGRVGMALSLLPAAGVAGRMLAGFARFRSGLFPSVCGF